MRKRISSISLLLAASALSAGLAAPALAQDHSGHTMPMPAPAPTPAPPPPPPAEEIDHANMDHSHGLETAKVGPEPDQPAIGRALIDQNSPDADDGERMRSCMEVFSHATCEAMAACDTASCGSVASRIPAVTEGSGTSRLPRAEGMMPGLHIQLGAGWMAMAHGYLWGIYTDQSGARGDDKAYVQSMAMLMAEKRFDWGRLQFKSMLSAEPLMSDRGYPNLFATGETANGQPLVDRQHPHDLFMELAGRVDVNIAENTTAFLYGGPVGEPALGPSAFMHRASARLNPEAPITHHWFDSTHITYGVITAGVAARTWQLEASAFRGQEPDEDRWDIEEPRLDSWSVRATLTPSPHWALQVSHARLDQPEALHPGEDEARTTASVHYDSGRGLAAMAAFSANDRRPGPTLTAWLAEANWDVASGHTLFGRVENVENDELFPNPLDPLHDVAFRVTKLQAGYAYTLPLGPFGLSLGGSAAAFLKPAALDPFYGDHPMGYTLFAKLTLGR